MALSKDEYKTLRNRCSGRFSYALKAGKFPPITENTKCVDCGKPAVAYDHRNYYKPYEVEPVCKKCNSQRGPAYPYCENWGEARPGSEDSEGHEESGFSESYLGLDFDFSAHDSHIKYMNIFEEDPDIKKLDKFKSVKVGRNYSYKIIEGRLYKFAPVWNKGLKKIMYDFVEVGEKKVAW